jgi:transcriptional regulator with XRE-family HTH domain
MVRSQKDGEPTAAIGRTVKMLREGQNLSQDQLALDAGVSRQTVSNIERGEHRADVKTLGKVAKALGVKISVLLDADVVDVEIRSEIRRAGEKMRSWSPDERERYVRALIDHRDRLESDRPKVIARKPR